MSIKETAEGFFLIDTYDMGVAGRTAVYLIRGRQWALIDTGSAHCLDRVLKDIRSAGVKYGELKYVILTHIHVDHAGAAGKLIREFPEAQVIVHPKGMPHLVAPAGLLTSTMKVLRNYPFRGSDFLPIEPERITAAQDGCVIDLGERQLTLFDTPGHAPHCISIYDSLTRGIFAGDSLGVRLDLLPEETPIMLDDIAAEDKAGDEADGGELFIPAMVLPRFEPEAALASAERLASLAPENIYFSHFGAARSAGCLIEKYRQCIKKAVEIADEIICEARGEAKEGFDNNAALERLCQRIREELLRVHPKKLLNIEFSRKVSLEHNLAGLLNQRLRCLPQS